MKLRAKLLLVTVPLIVLSLLALATVAYWQLHRQASELKLQAMTAMLGEMQREVATLLAATRANLDLFAHSVLLRRYLAGGAAGAGARSPTSLVEEFRNYQRAQPLYREIQVLWPDGGEAIRIGAPSRGEPPRVDAAFFQRLATLSSDGYAERFVPDSGSGVPILRMGTGLRLADAGRTVSAYLLLAVDLEVLVRHVTRPRPHGIGIAYLDRDARAILPVRPALEGMNRQVLLTALATGTTMTIPHRDMPMRLQARRVHPELYLVGYLPEAALLSTSRRLRDIGLLILLVVTGLTVVLLLAFQQRFLVGPVQALHRAMRAFAEDPRRLPVLPTGSDEIGELSRTFAGMVQGLRDSHERISFLAYHDSLTGLPNRIFIQEHLGHALAGLQRTGRCLGLFFLDLDGFKLVNDSLGHSMGDELLKTVGKTLLGCLRGEDVVCRGEADIPWESGVLARLGGDKFLVVVGDLPGEAMAERVARRLLWVLETPFHIQGEVFTVSASIGVAVAPEHGDTPERLIRHADMAMYDAKAQGRNNFRIFRTALKTETVWRRHVDTRLRQALEQGALELHYQPQVALADCQVVGCEALLRWHDAELGWVSPGRFIPVIEQTGLIRPVSEWVFREACRQARAWRDGGLPPLEMGVNLSAAHLDSPELVETVAGILAETGLPPGQLLLELTETSVMSGQQAGLGVLQGLKSLGLRIALDDFGTGYSSLSYLRRFPIDELKIDQSFLRNLDDPGDAALVATIIAMGRGMGFEVVAEGVETGEQLQFLREHGCHRVQGYLFSRPLPAAEFQHWLTIRMAESVESSAAPGC